MSNESDYLLAGNSNTGADRPVSNDDRIRRVLSLLVCAVYGFAGGVQYVTSYLIHPIQTACSPPWSSSATVYGSSALAVGWIASGFFASCLTGFVGIRWIMTAVIMLAAAQGIAGVSVIFCKEMNVIGEILYISMFPLMAFGISTIFMIMVELAIRRLPDKPGFAGAIFCVSSGFGSLASSQIVIGLRTLFASVHINEGTIFLCLGLFTVILLSPWLPVISTSFVPRDKTKTSITKETNVYEEQKKSMNVMMLGYYVLFCVVILCAYIPVMGVIVYQEPLMLAIWTTSDPPVSFLAAILMGSYVTGRVLCLILSDKIGLKNIMLLAFFLSSILFLGLALSIILKTKGAQSRYLGMFFLAAYMLVNPIYKGSAGGLCHYLYGPARRSFTLGLYTIMSGLGGIMGPLIVNGTYSGFGNYKPFLMGSSVVSIIGLVSLWFIRPVQTVKAVMSSNSDSYSCAELETQSDRL